MKNSVKIGNVLLKSCLSVAPMAGLTDLPLRSLIRKYSKNCLITTEMLSSEALMFRQTGAILETNENEAPIAFQISGHKPEIMAKAAKILEPKATIIDINMGCPIHKIVKGHDGSALMNTPELAQDIVRAVKEAVNLPVTCKFRLGWSQESMNYLDFAVRMQEAGADAITVHARTRAQLYSGSADWEKLSILKGEIDIPYFANGDVVDFDSAMKCLEITKADGLAIGRGAIGDVTLFSRIEHYLETGEIIPQPSLKERINVLKKHLELETRLRGELNGIKFIRKFYPYYIKAIKGAPELRGKIMTEENYQNILNILNQIQNL